MLKQLLFQELGLILTIELIMDLTSLIMTTLKSFLKNADFSSLTKDIQGNLLILLEKINRLEDIIGYQFQITSGLRTKEDQLRIYKAKGVPENKIPWGSAHLKGAACDVSDPSKSIANWCHSNENILEELGLWCEDTDFTKNWVHFQTYAPKSGKRFFKP